jgi:drug/metabolite transporter (DMT)-like permease
VTTVILVVSQLLFTVGDLLARANMKAGGFTVANLCKLWFLAYFTVRTIATFGQLYVLANVQVGRMSALFGAASIVLANVFGFLLLKEVLTPTAYIGVGLAVTAFLVMALR